MKYTRVSKSSFSNCNHQTQCSQAKGMRDSIKPFVEKFSNIISTTDKNDNPFAFSIQTFPHVDKTCPVLPHSFDVQPFLTPVYVPQSQQQSVINSVQETILGCKAIIDRRQHAQEPSSNECIEEQQSLNSKPSNESNTSSQELCEQLLEYSDPQAINVRPPPGDEQHKPANKERLLKTGPFKKGASSEQLSAPSSKAIDPTTEFRQGVMQDAKEGSNTSLKPDKAIIKKISIDDQKKEALLA